MTQMRTGSILGNAVRRVEDPDLVAGRRLRRRPPGRRHRSTRSSSAAPSPTPGSPASTRPRPSAAPGVVAVYTARRPGPATRCRRSPRSTQACARPALAVDAVRFVGDPVALVVAETRAQAVDAAELVDVDYDQLPVVADMEAALRRRRPAAVRRRSAATSPPAARDPDDSTRSPAPTRRAGCGSRTSASPSRPIEGNAILVEPDGTTGVTACVSPPSSRTWRAT